MHSLYIATVIAKPHFSSIIQVHLQTEELGNTLEKLSPYFFLQQDTVTAPDKLYELFCFWLFLYRKK